MEENKKNIDVISDGVDFLMDKDGDEELIIIMSFDQEHVSILKSYAAEEGVYLSTINSTNKDHKGGDSYQYSSVILSITHATQLRDFLNQFLESE